MNNNPFASKSIAQIDAIADDIIPFWDDAPEPRPFQIKSRVRRYCDDPAITDRDINRICIRIEQHFGLDD